MINLSFKNMIISEIQVPLVQTIKIQNRKVIIKIIYHLIILITLMIIRVDPVRVEKSVMTITIWDLKIKIRIMNSIFKILNQIEFLKLFSIKNN